MCFQPLRYTLVIRMLAADEITYLAPNRFTTRAHEVQQSKPAKEVIIESSSAIKVRDSADTRKLVICPTLLACPRPSLAGLWHSTCVRQQPFQPQSVGMLSS